MSVRPSARLLSLYASHGHTLSKDMTIAIASYIRLDRAKESSKVKQVACLQWLPINIV